MSIPWDRNTIRDKMRETLGLVVHIYNPSLQEAEAERARREASLDYTRAHLKKSIKMSF